MRYAISSSALAISRKPSAICSDLSYRGQVKPDRLSPLHRGQELPELRILEHPGPSMDQHDVPVCVQQDDGWRSGDLEGLRHVVVDVERGREDERVRVCLDIPLDIAAQVRKADRDHTE